MRFLGMAVVGTTVLATLLSPPAANSLTMRECSAKYRAAQAAGTLKGMTWNDFRKSQCGPGASAAPTGAATGAAPEPKSSSAPKSGGSSKTATTPPATLPSPAGNVIYPAAVSPKYSSEPAGKARMHTCLDQYNANKATNANGGMKWIQKGGGYYSECNKRLKA